jgi:hypothetical protein
MRSLRYNGARLIGFSGHDRWMAAYLVIICHMSGRIGSGDGPGHRCAESGSKYPGVLQIGVYQQEKQISPIIVLRGLQYVRLFR